jgi:hypothetical protein
MDLDDFLNEPDFEDDFVDESTSPTKSNPDRELEDETFSGVQSSRDEEPQKWETLDDLQVFTVGGESSSEESEDEEKEDPTAGDTFDSREFGDDFIDEEDPPEKTKESSKWKTLEGLQSFVTQDSESESEAATSARSMKKEAEEEEEPTGWATLEGLSSIVVGGESSDEEEEKDDDFGFDDDEEEEKKEETKLAPIIPKISAQQLAQKLAQPTTIITPNRYPSSITSSLIPSFQPSKVLAPSSLIPPMHSSIRTAPPKSESPQQETSKSVRFSFDKTSGMTDSVKSLSIRSLEEQIPQQITKEQPEERKPNEIKQSKQLALEKTQQKMQPVQQTKVEVVKEPIITEKQPIVVQEVKPRIPKPEIISVSAPVVIETIEDDLNYDTRYRIPPKPRIPVEREQHTIMDSMPVPRVVERPYRPERTLPKVQTKIQFIEQDQRHLDHKSFEQARFSKISQVKEPRHSRNEQEQYYREERRPYSSTNGVGKTRTVAGSLTKRVDLIREDSVLQIILSLYFNQAILEDGTMNTSSSFRKQEHQNTSARRLSSGSKQNQARRRSEQAWEPEHIHHKTDHTLEWTSNFRERGSLADTLQQHLIPIIGTANNSGLLFVALTDLSGALATIASYSLQTSIIKYEGLPDDQQIHDLVKSVMAVMPMVALDPVTYKLEYWVTLQHVTEMIYTINQVVRAYLWAGETRIPQARDKFIRSDMNMSLFKCHGKGEAMTEGPNSVVAKSLQKLGVDVNHPRTNDLIQETLTEMVSDTMIAATIAQRVKQRLLQERI